MQESSNGCASGGCLTEAVYFGLMEVIERDAFLLAWYGRARLPEIDPATGAPAAEPGAGRPAGDVRLRRPVLRHPDDVRESRSSPRSRSARTAAWARCASARAPAWTRRRRSPPALCEIATDAVNLRRRTERDEARLRAMAADFDRVRTLHDHPLLYGIPEMRRHAAFLLDGAPDRVAAGRAGRCRPRCRPATWPTTWPGACGCCRRPGLRRGRGRPDRCRSSATLGLATASVLVPGLLPIDFGWARQRALRMPRLRTALREAGRADRDLAPGRPQPRPAPVPVTPSPTAPVLVRARRLRRRPEMSHGPAVRRRRSCTAAGCRWSRSTSSRTGGTGRARPSTTRAPSWSRWPPATTRPRRPCRPG